MSRASRILHLHRRFFVPSSRQEQHMPEGNKVVIGDIDAMSGVYADIIGPGGVEAAKMAIADSGGVPVLGQKIEFLVSDHQNKPDLGAEKFREWADRDGITMVLVLVPIPASISRRQQSQREKNTSFFASARRAHHSPARIVRLTRCTMPTNTTALGKRHLDHYSEAGRKVAVLPDR